MNTNCMLTVDELRTLCCMCQEKAAYMAAREHHKNLDTNAVYQRVLSISHKAYEKLIEIDQEVNSYD